MNEKPKCESTGAKRDRIRRTILNALQARRQSLRRLKNRETSADFEALRHERINATFEAEQWLEELI